MTQAYGEAWYWDKRYAKESTTTFDWYQKYESLSPLLHLYIPTSTSTRRRVLVVGCGNSAFSEGMSKDGYTDIVNIDISSVVIEAMQKKYSDSPHLKYIEMDVRDMKAFENNSFDAVIDKGTLDSLLCGLNSKQNAAKMLEEVDRVLKKEGVYILITYGIPAYRICLLKESHSWAIKLHVIDKYLPGESSKGETWELTRPVPLNSDGSLKDGSPLENMDVHYIYVCTKV
uniref:eEF1A lysine and N-terminal methyltransferase n=1 Tax=Erigeron canadensis TaxID=72917 RepID=UPI001CB9427A|nr:eEF1A lysine and N-terminal methyltransferase [Erigeron canadensis]